MSQKFLYFSVIIILLVLITFSLVRAVVIENVDLLKLVPKTTAPASPSPGWIYYDSGTDMPKIYKSTGWSEFKGPQGLKGDKGDTGLTGPKGDQGDPGPPGPAGDITGQTPSWLKATELESTGNVFAPAFRSRINTNLVVDAGDGSINTMTLYDNVSIPGGDLTMGAGKKINLGNGQIYWDSVNNRLVIKVQ